MQCKNVNGNTKSTGNINIANSNWDKLEVQSANNNIHSMLNWVKIVEVQCTG